ncbi:MAG: BamA/TamA family outer membrane protein [bacterium]
MNLPGASKIYFWVVAITILMTASVHGQFYFGKNKVQYTRFDWQVMTTDHFRVYFYEDETELARAGARLAEEAYRELAPRFNHEILKKVPLIIYSSPSYFSQTNVIPGLLPESVGGFTEFMKGRVVVPFNGSHADFAHVIKHELVHAFMISRLDEIYKRRTRLRPFYPPLWFTEGLAEYWSKEWDARSDMVVGDMVMGEKLFTLDRIHQIRGTFYMYKLGESVLHFIDSTYGRDQIARIFDNWHKGRDFDEVVKITLGDDLKELSRRWAYQLKKRYYPELAEAGLPDMESVQLTKDGFSEKGVPIRWDDGSGPADYVVYKGYRLGYSGIYLCRLRNAKARDCRTLVKGERSAAYESLHLLRSGIDANDSGLVVFSSKSKENDVLYIYDLGEGAVTERFEFQSLVEARSPRLSHDGRRVTFVGVKKDGYADIYVLNLDGGEYHALTNDVYFDTDPCFTIDDKAVVFSSDRCDDGPAGALNLYRVDLNGSRMTQLTYGAFRDQTPECAESGVYCSSDRNGISNIYLLDTANRLIRQTSLATGAFDPRLASDGRTLIYTGYQDMRYHVYQGTPHPETTLTEQPPVAMAPAWNPRQIDSKFSRSTIKYQTDYSLDIAQSAVGYDPIQGSLGGLQAAVSDMLGNRSYYILVTNTAQTKDEFLKAFNLGVTYVNRERRLNWGFGLFHLYDEYYNDFDKYYFERQAGGVGLLSYPISKFNRVDLTTIARYSDRDSRFDFNERETFLMTNYLSWIYDNSLWDISGPIDGRRYNFTLGLTTSLDRRQTFNRLAMADVRHYFRLGRYSALANRLLAYTSSGREPQRIYLGGSWSFRGYPRRAFYNRNVLFASTELRFPLIDVLLIGFPFGGLDFRGIRGALFFDAGSAWDNDFDRFRGSFGAGFRVSLGYVVQLRFDFTRTTDFETISPNTEFDFFFGWNF